ncbi:MAG TPA: copper chaperone PCu(A)C [Xanthomonadaceae bacterium]|nr:copper chaperone PCu(A)C [Xanthomonadaceae bacterium]
MDIRIRSLPLLLVLALGGACAGAVEFSEGWVRAGPPGASTYAGYGTIHNDGKRPLRIRACASSSFAGAEIHRTDMEQGVARMRAVDELVVAPGESVALEPEGTHLMLTEPTGPVEPGQVVLICISSRDFTLELKLPVRDARTRAEDRSDYSGH